MSDKCEFPKCEMTNRTDGAHGPCNSWCYNGDAPSCKDRTTLRCHDFVAPTVVAPTAPPIVAPVEEVKDSRDERIKALETRCNQLVKEIDAISEERADLQQDLATAESSLEEATVKQNEYYHKTRLQDKQIRDLEDRLKSEQSRSRQALDVADDVAKGFGAMSAMAYRLNEISERLERKERE